MLYTVSRRKATRHGNGAARANGYTSWVGMRNRCYCTTDKNYAQYGGRGITVCDRWMDENNGYLNFIADIGNRPTDKHSVERINVNGNYEPSNCKWATATEQNNNKSDNTFLTHKNETKTISQWAREMDIPHRTIRARIRYNWSVEDVLETPVYRDYIGRKSNPHNLKQD